MDTEPHWSSGDVTMVLILKLLGNRGLRDEAPPHCTESLARPLSVTEFGLTAAIISFHDLCDRQLARF